MIGLGVVRECLLDPDVTKLLVVVRTESGVRELHALEAVPSGAFEKLETIVSLDVRKIEVEGFDACFFCLGVSSAGMEEADYRRVTYDLTLDVAKALVRKNPTMTFIYVSGAGTDSSEKGRSMWARVKGETENALLRLPFKTTCMFRPGFIQPMHGIRSKTTIYRTVYALLSPLYPVFKLLVPTWVTTTEALGKAMMRVAKEGPPAPIVESAEINRLAVN